MYSKKQKRIVTKEKGFFKMSNNKTSSSDIFMPRFTKYFGKTCMKIFKRKYQFSMNNVEFCST